MNEGNSAEPSPPANQIQAYRAIYKIGKPRITSITVDGTEHTLFRFLNDEVVELLRELGHTVTTQESTQASPMWSHEAPEVQRALRDPDNDVGPNWLRTENATWIVETPGSERVAGHKANRARFEAAVREAGLRVVDLECQTVHSANVCQPLGAQETVPEVRA